jgi:CheY-like chemotaxis protein
MFLHREVLVMDKFLSGRRILVIEDEMMVLMLVEDMLADLGCKSVTAAATVEQALALIGAHDFDAALLDMNLNGTKSHDVAQALATHNVPFAFATGYSSLDISGGYRGLPVLRKPFSSTELVGVFTRLLSR